MYTPDRVEVEQIHEIMERTRYSPVFTMDWVKSLEDESILTALYAVGMGHRIYNSAVREFPTDREREGHI